MTKVEFRTVLQWQCPNCDERHPVVPIVQEATEEQVRRFFQLEDWEELPDPDQRMRIGLLPQQVTCNCCLHSFETNVNQPGSLEEFLTHLEFLPGNADDEEDDSDDACDHNDAA